MDSDNESDLKAQKQKRPGEESNVVDLTSGSAPPAAAGLETIQKILFGEQMRAGQEQVEKVSQESNEALNKLSERINDRLDKLTEAMNAQFEAINQKLEQQRSHAKAIENQASSEISACKLALTQSIDSTRKELTLEMKNSLADLENRTVDRGKLSEIFTQVAQEVTLTSSQTKA